MKQKLPLNFYFKLSFILLVILGTYLMHRPLVDASIANPALSTTDTLQAILKEILGFQGSTDGEVAVVSPVEIVSQPGNRTPQQVSDEVALLENYQHATERASQFNQNFPAEGLNEAFNQRVNEYRQETGAEQVEIGNHLAEGTQMRARQLSQYHYLGSETVEGDTIYSLFPNVTDGPYRLGENLYELYIAADDIHLETWQNPTILADYLYDVFKDSVNSELYQQYQKQYLWVQAGPTDYNIDSAAYVRLVVVLMLDTDSSTEALSADY